MRSLIGALALFFHVGGQAFAASPVGDWPCVQRKVAELSAGQMWSGPALDAAGNWRDDTAVAALVEALAARRTPIEDAAAAIERFAKESGSAKPAKLTLLFAGAFERLNAERSRLIIGIERYARKQRALADRIKENALAFSAEKKPELEQALRWDRRIYDERNQALVYVCESPTLLEQRAFALAREIQNHL